MLQNVIFSDNVNVILIFLVSKQNPEVPFGTLYPYRKREHLVEAAFSKSGLLNVPLTVHLSNKLTLNNHVRTDYWLWRKKGRTHSVENEGTLVPLAHRTDVFKTDMVKLGSEKKTWGETGNHDTENDSSFTHTCSLFLSCVYQMQSRKFLSRPAATEMTLSQHFSRLWWNPAALKGQRAKGLELGSADNFLRVSVCACKRVRVAVPLAKKEIPDAEEFVFTGNFVCVSMRGEVMRTAENTNTTNTRTNFL